MPRVLPKAFGDGFEEECAWHCERGYSGVEREKAWKIVVGFGLGVGFRILLGIVRVMYIASMGRSFKDSLKLLEADIHHANTLLVSLFFFSLSFQFFAPL